MAEEIVGEEIQSDVLTEDEVSKVVETEEGVLPEDSPTLPSDEPEFEVPEKFKGKSAAEIAKAYVELEKLKAKQAEDEVDTEGATDETDTEEDTTTKEDKSEPLVKPEEYQTFEETYRKNGDLTEEQYAELEKRGITKEMVQEEIAYREFQEDRAIKRVLEPAGLTKDNLQEMIAWAQENKSEKEINEFNTALAQAPLVAQQAMVKSLYQEMKSSGDLTVHASKGTPISTKGYATESDFMKDISNPAYQTDKSYVAAVERKLAASNTDNWSF